MVKLGIAFIPDAETINTIIEFQQQISLFYPLKPLLGTDTNLPHITLLQGRFKEPINWLELLSELRDYCHNQLFPLQVQLTELKYQSPNWLFLNFSPNLLLTETHKFTFDRLKSRMLLTELDRQKDTTGYTQLEKINYDQYGYRYIETAFCPHITLGTISSRFSTKDRQKINYLFQSLLRNLIATITRVTVYQLGEYGNHARSLYDLYL
jgi:2'-5' RNA ligase